jgi:hypothetical protein
MTFIPYYTCIAHAQLLVFSRALDNIKQPDAAVYIVILQLEDAVPVHGHVVESMMVRMRS